MSISVKLMKFNFNSKQGKLFRALVIDRETLTPAEIARRFNIKNPTATISNIRHRGYAIYGVQRKAANNVMVTEYSYGEASRKMVAIAYKAIAAGMYA